MDTKEHGKMFRRILTLQTARRWKIEGQKRSHREKERKWLRFHGAKRVVGHFKKQRMLENRGALPREDGDLLREYQAMHEANFLSSYLRGDVDGKEKEREKINKEAKEEERKIGKREVEGEREAVETSSERISMNRLVSPDVSGEVFEA